MSEWKHGMPAPNVTGPVIETAVTPSEAETLGEIAHGHDVLEVGAAYGYSTVAMALAGATAVVSVDHHREYSSADRWQAAINAYDVAETVTPVFAASDQVLPWLWRTGARFRFIFLDADHHAPAVAHDVPWCWRLLEPYGTLACHDYRQPVWPDVATVLDRLHPDGPDRTVGTLWIKQRR